ncbi:MAG: hypothetical protein AMXMBFR13_12180 [Phycisphaerae bacterium]
MMKQIRSVTLYSFTAPLALMPLMGFGFDQIVPYLKGAEFRSILAEMLTQLVSGVVDAAIIAAVQSAFGVTFGA